MGKLQLADFGAVSFLTMMEQAYVSFPLQFSSCSDDCSSAKCSLQTSGGLAIEENHFFWWLCVLLGLHFTGINIHVLGTLHRLSPSTVITTLQYQCYLLPPALEMRKLRLREVEGKRGLNPGLSDSKGHVRPFTDLSSCLCPTFMDLSIAYKNQVKFNGILAMNYFCSINTILYSSYLVQT